jgi:nucleotide-binding universal stress UspA family protein
MMDMYKKILLATDGSGHSTRAAEQAISLARCNSDSVLHIVYVVDGDTSKSDVLRNWNVANLNDKRKERIRSVEELVRTSGVSYKVEILHGEPGPTIVQHANEQSFDVVVIGSRGLNGLQELVLGSVSHKVAKRAACPVLIVK